MATELFANAFATTLAAPCAAGDATITTSAAAPAALQTSGGQFRIIVDSEYMIVTAGAATTTWTVTRGAEGSTAVSHLSAAAVTHILTAGGLANGTGAITVQGTSGANLGATQTIDFASTQKSVWLVGTLNANLTVTVSNRVAGSRSLLILTQDGTGGRTLTVSDGSSSQPVTINSLAGTLSVVEVSCPDTAAIDAVSPIAALADQQVLLRNLSDLTRDPWLVSGHIAQSLDRRLVVNNVSLTSGVMFLVAVPVPGGRTINNITVYSTNVGATTPTNQWAALYDSSRNLLQTGVDQTTAAWGTNTLRTFALAAPVTTSTGSLMYAAVMVAAATAPNLAGLSANANPIGLTPQLCFTSSVSGLTTPATAPASVTAGSTKAPFWASLS